MAVQLALDIGNTRLHWALFNDRELVDSGACSQDDFPSLQFDEVVIASVVNISASLLSKLGDKAPFFVNAKSKLPIELDYETPDTLGADRIAGAVGASTLFPGSNVMSIDMGTCITYDIVTSEGVYVGGAISPGANMRAKAMNSYTDRLPFVKAEFPDSFIGNSTEASLKSGIMYGIANEIEGMKSRLEAQYGKINTVLTGGDASLFVEVLKNHIFADPNLVLKGLNEILLFNRA